MIEQHFIQLTFSAASPSSEHVTWLALALIFSDLEDVPVAGGGSRAHEEPARQLGLATVAQQAVADVRGAGAAVPRELIANCIYRTCFFTFCIQKKPCFCEIFVRVCARAPYLGKLT